MTLPEKPKRSTKNTMNFPKNSKPEKKTQYRPVRWLLIVFLGLPVPIMILLNPQINGEQFVDMILIGVMLCCVVYILYYVIQAMITDHF